MLRISLIALLFIVPTAQAAYYFDVKVINNMTQDVTVKGVRFTAKAGLPNVICDYIPAARQEVSPGGFVNPTCSANVGKWRRKVHVNFLCPQNSNPRILTFPRNGNWYKRNHAVDNGNRYTVRLRDSDC